MNNLTYGHFKIQDYFTSSQFTSEEKNIIFSLRSSCFPAKNNFRNMNKGNLKCNLNCDAIKTQIHILEHCEPVRSRLNHTETPTINGIYGRLSVQKSAVEIFLKKLTK